MRNPQPFATVEIVQFGKFCDLSLRLRHLVFEEAKPVTYFVSYRALQDFVALGANV